MHTNSVLWVITSNSFHYNSPVVYGSPISVADPVADCQINQDGVGPVTAAVDGKSLTNHMRLVGTWMSVVCGLTIALNFPRRSDLFVSICLLGLGVVLVCISCAYSALSQL